MDVTLGLGSLVSGLASGIGGLVQGRRQMKLAREQMEMQREENQASREHNLMLAKMQNQWNKEAYQQEFQDRVKMWDMENEYNSASSKMKRAIEAGINPYFAAGDAVGSSAGSISAPTMAEMTSGAPAVPTDYSEAFRTAASATQRTTEAALAAAQIANIDANTQLTKKKTEGETALNVVRWSDAKFRDAYNSGLIELQNCEIYLKGTSADLNKQEIENLKKEMSVMDATIPKLKEETNKLRQEIANLSIEEKSKALDLLFKNETYDASVEQLRSQARITKVEADYALKMMLSRIANIDSNTFLNNAHKNLADKELLLMDVEMVNAAIAGDTAQFNLDYVKEHKETMFRVQIASSLMQQVANLLGSGAIAFGVLGKGGKIFQTVVKGFGK